MSAAPRPTQNRSRQDRSLLLGCLQWLALTLIAIALIIGIVVWKFAAETSDLVREGGDFLNKVGDLLHSRSITESFHDELLKVASTDGDVLELATVELNETIARRDMRTALNDYLNLGTTVSEIKVPVVYRYHLRLSDPWQIRIEDGVCHVTSPPIRPTLPPAIRTDGMEKKSAAGWLRFNAAESLAALEKELTPKIETRASDSRHIDMAREAARQSVVGFVRKWVIESHPDASDLPIQVRFSDENPAPNPPAAPAF